MLIFAKDIRKRDHLHAREEFDPKLREYMEYQRKLFPYTIIRGGLDFAYKELDDILRFVDNDHKPPPDVSRQDFPADVGQWFSNRFPWTSAFMSMEDMHGLMVRLIGAMDSFRTLEVLTAWHLAVLYDTTHNIIEIYNTALKDGNEVSRDIHLSSGVPVLFEDFINNHWPHLEFMLLSKPDYPHAKLLERNFLIEDYVKTQIADGLHPLEVLKMADEKFNFNRGTLELLRRDEITPELADFTEIKIEDDPFDSLYLAKNSNELSSIDSDYERNFKDTGSSLSQLK